MKPLNLVIFAGSNKPVYYQHIKKELICIAKGIDKTKFDIWYGGGDEGIMSVIPRTFHEKGGNVFSVDWKVFINKYGSASFGTNYEMDTFEERQKELISKGDVYLCLPGGVGTLSELFDVLVSNDVHKKNKKIVLFSYNSFFSDIQEFLQVKTEQGFIKAKNLDNILIFEKGSEVIDFLNINTFGKN